MKICTIIGARPQFIKAAVVSAKIVEYNNSTLKTRHSKLEEVIIHTGQHYDREMSEIFFQELGIPREKYNLQVGSGSHGQQTGRMIEAIEKVLDNEKPDWTLVYGDTNSTLAGALAAVKLHIPVAHIEAGMRSFNREMPEEINRVVADHVCELNFCSTKTAVENLKKEGLEHTAHLTGDVMYDCSLKFAEVAKKYCNPLKKFNLKTNDYILITCHRAENTDDKSRLSQIIEAVNKISDEIPILYPVHPRTKGFLKKHKLSFSENIKIVPPVSYLEMLILEKNARIILTDSGGVQKEAFFYNVPCVTMRNETEWVETVELGWNVISGADQKKILSSVANFTKHPPKPTKVKPYGNGDATDKIVNYLSNTKQGKI